MPRTREIGQTSNAARTKPLRKLSVRKRLTGRPRKRPSFAWEACLKTRTPQEKPPTPSKCRRRTKGWLNRSVIVRMPGKMTKNLATRLRSPSLTITKSLRPTAPSAELISTDEVKNDWRESMYEWIYVCVRNIINDDYEYIFIYRKTNCTLKQKKIKVPS